MNENGNCQFVIINFWWIHTCTTLLTLSFLWWWWCECDDWVLAESSLFESFSIFLLYLFFLLQHFNNFLSYRKNFFECPLLNIGALFIFYSNLNVLMFSSLLSYVRINIYFPYLIFSQLFFSLIYINDYRWIE